MREHAPRSPLHGWIVLVALVAALAGCATTETPEAAVVTVSGADAVAAITDPEAVVIDVRTPQEVAEGLIDGAVNIDFSAGDFTDRVEELDRDGRYVLYCRTGNRSGQAATVMAGMGFTNLVNAGGYAELVEAGAPAATQ